jgi:hypothetical protein
MLEAIEGATTVRTRDGVGAGRCVLLRASKIAEHPD